MKKLKLDDTILPVTDLKQVIDEINKYRLVLDMMEKARVYQKKYNIMYQERRKRNGYTYGQGRKARKYQKGTNLKGQGMV